MKAEYQQDANSNCLVLRIKSSGFEKRIRAEDIGKFACDHDSLISDCGRCWDCGMAKPLRHAPLNWALPKLAD